MRSEDAPCRYFAIELDETSNWLLDNLLIAHPKIPKPAKIRAVYLCSPDIGTYLCESTPSVWLKWVYSYPEWLDGVEPSEEQREIVEDLILIADLEDEGSHYRHRSDFLEEHGTLASMLNGDSFVCGEIFSEDEKHRWAYVGTTGEDENEESLFEHLLGNPIF